MMAGDASVDPALFPVEFRLLFRCALLLIRAGCQMCRQQQVLSAHLDELRAAPRDPSPHGKKIRATRARRPARSDQLGANFSEGKGLGV